MYKIKTIRFAHVFVNQSISPKAEEIESNFFRELRDFGAFHGFSKNGRFARNIWYVKNVSDVDKANDIVKRYRKQYAALVKSDTKKILTDDQIMVNTFFRHEKKTRKSFVKF